MATSVASNTPTLEELVQAAEGLLPNLRARAQQTEQLRHLPPETVAEFKQLGLFRVFQPKRYGGFELDYGRTQVELCNVLGQACGSSAWVQCVVACHSWALGMFAPEVQEAVWGDDPETLISSAFSFKTGRGGVVDGGYFIEGDWEFSSGSDLCQWIILGTPIFGETPGPPLKVIWCLIKRPDWQILDTWYAPGLKGSASNDIRVPGVFVPEAFTLDTSLCDGRPTPGSAVNPSPLYRLPLWPIFPYNVSTEALGVARGAVNAYIDSLRARPQRASMLSRQMLISETSAMVDAATALVRENARVIAHAIHTDTPLDPAFLMKSTRDTTFAVQLCVQAVDKLSLMMGAHGMQEDATVNRALRDVHTIANHGANTPDSFLAGWARFTLGLPPAAAG